MTKSNGQISGLHGADRADQRQGQETALAGHTLRKCSTSERTDAITQRMAGGPGRGLVLSALYFVCIIHKKYKRYKKHTRYSLPWPRRWAGMGKSASVCRFQILKRFGIWTQKKGLSRPGHQEQRGLYPHLWE